MKLKVCCTAKRNRFFCEHFATNQAKNAAHGYGRARANHVFRGNVQSRTLIQFSFVLKGRTALHNLVRTLRA